MRPSIYRSFQRLKVAKPATSRSSAPGLPGSMRQLSLRARMSFCSTRTNRDGARPGAMAGFCCLGGAKVGHRTLKRRHGVAEALCFAKAERSAVDHVAERLETGGIDADRHSDGETYLAHSPRAFAGFEAEIETSEELYGVTPEVLPRDALAQAGDESRRDLRHHHNTNRICAEPCEIRCGPHTDGGEFWHANSWRYTRHLSRA